MKLMRKLNLPVIKGSLPPARHLSMDDYLKFVEFNLRCAFDKKANRRWKKLSAVNTRFILR